jgi:predicted TIM-barrel fold metal-dependent hydrolase
MGADRILFAADYPYEDYDEAGTFIETSADQRKRSPQDRVRERQGAVQAVEG